MHRPHVLLPLIMNSKLGVLVDTSVLSIAVQCRSCVRIITSQRSAMGKSLYIKRLGDDLEQRGMGLAECDVVTIPLHGPHVDCDVLMKLLGIHMKKNKTCIYHIDVASSVRN